MKTKSWQRHQVCQRSLTTGLLLALLPALTRTLWADPEVFLSFPFNVDPGWSAEGAWAFGVPTGGGTHNLDPTSGYTGTNVYGFNLAGDYGNSLTNTVYLTTPALDCSGHAAVKLGFWRWLGVDSSSRDKAVVQASRDHTNWVTLWSNSRCVDTNWVYVEYDLSQVADGASSVFVRWGLGPTDDADSYPGWNIDDVMFSGERGVSNAVSVAATHSPALEDWTRQGHFEFNRTGPVTEPLTVRFAVDGTAIPGADYEPIPHWVTIPAGEATARVSVTPMDDLEVEGPASETVGISIESDPAYTTKHPATAKLRIEDNDQPPLVAVRSAQDTAGEGGSPGLFVLTRAAVHSSELLTVNLAVGGSAGHGLDYVLTGVTGTNAVFPPGETAISIQVSALDDEELDPNETVVLTVSSADGLVYRPGSPSSATVTIADNEAPVVTVLTTDSAGEEGADGEVAFLFARTGPTDTALAVFFSTASGTTASSSDYGGWASPITIPAGAASAMLSLHVKDDSIAEEAESLTVKLTPRSTYNIGESSAATAVLYDNEPVELQIIAPDPSASERGNTGRFTILRRGALAPALTAGLQFSGTAVPGVDVPNLPNTLAIEAKTREVSIAFSALADDECEGTETLTATLLPGVGYSARTNQADMRIVDSCVRLSATINVDFLSIAEDPPNAYVGGDGVFSSVAASHWNGVPPFPRERRGLLDEFGQPTSVEVHVDTFCGFKSLGVPPYSSGQCNGNGACQVNLYNVDPTKTYDVAVYFDDWESRITLLGSGRGETFRGLSRLPTGRMPGIENADFLLFTNVPPAEFESGYVGFSLVMPGATCGSYCSDSYLAALQIREHVPAGVAIQSPRFAGSEFRFDFTAQPGGAYRIECRDDLTEDRWTQLGNDIVADSTIETVSDANGNSRRFYRVVVLP